jgi:hypothetical protein
MDIQKDFEALKAHHAKHAFRLPTFGQSSVAALRIKGHSLEDIQRVTGYSRHTVKRNASIGKALPLCAELVEVMRF